MITNKKLLILLAHVILISGLCYDTALSMEARQAQGRGRGPRVHQRIQQDPALADIISAVVHPRNGTQPDYQALCQNVSPQDWVKQRPDEWLYYKDSFITQLIRVANILHLDDFIKLEQFILTLLDHLRSSPDALTTLLEPDHFKEDVIHRTCLLGIPSITKKLIELKIIVTTREEFIVYLTTLQRDELLISKVYSPRQAALPLSNHSRYLPHMQATLNHYLTGLYQYYGISLSDTNDNLPSSSAASSPPEIPSYHHDPYATPVTAEKAQDNSQTTQHNASDRVQQPPHQNQRLYAFRPEGKSVFMFISDTSQCYSIICTGRLKKILGIDLQYDSARQQFFYVRHYPCRDGERLSTPDFNPNCPPAYHVHELPPIYLLRCKESEDLFLDAEDNLTNFAGQTVGRFTKSPGEEV